MKKYMVSGLISGLCCLFPILGMAEEPANSSPQTTWERPLALRVQPPAQARALFKQRNKQIRKLVKQYRKATSAEEKAQIKQQLTQLVSAAMDEGMAWSKERIAAEKANLEHWEQKMAEREAQWPQVKARRVDELLSGEGERRFKLAKKRWKKEMAEVRKRMR